MKMKFVWLIIALVHITQLSIAQNKSNVEQRTPVVKNDASWNKTENETSQSTNTQTISDGITINSKQNGIYITMPKAVANVKLFSLTGELVWAGNLVQGRFFIPTQAGIYFLRVNNKSYKVVCK
jgi:hypothetical protein